MTTEEHQAMQSIRKARIEELDEDIRILKATADTKSTWDNEIIKEWIEIAYNKGQIRAYNDAHMIQSS